jgi:hypothetical protein
MVTRVDPVTGQRINSFYGSNGHTFISEMNPLTRRVKKINTKFD